MTLKEELSLQLERSSANRESSSAGPRPHNISALYGSTPVDTENSSTWNPYADLPLSSSIDPSANVTDESTDGGQSKTGQSNNGESNNGESNNGESNNGQSAIERVDNEDANEDVNEVSSEDESASNEARCDIDSGEATFTNEVVSGGKVSGGKVSGGKVSGGKVSGGKVPKPKYRSRVSSGVSGESIISVAAVDRGQSLGAVPIAEYRDVLEQVGHPVPTASTETLEGNDLPTSVEQSERAEARPGEPTTPHSDMRSRSNIAEKREPLLAEIADAPSAEIPTTDAPAADGLTADAASNETPEILGSLGATEKKTSESPARSSRLRDLKLRLDIPKVAVRENTIAQPRRFEECLLANINDSVKSQQYQQLATTIQNQFPTESHATVLIVGCEADMKFSETVATLGAYLAESMGRDCLLVDAAPGPASLSSRFDQVKASGFADLIAGRHDWKELVLRTYFENLTLLPAGRCAISKNAQTAPDTARLLESVKRLHRYTLVAAGENPLTPLLGRICDVTYLVVQLGATESQQATETVAQLRSSGARVLGCVVLGDDE